MIVIPDASKVLLLKWILGIESPPASVVYRFYTNDHTPGEATVLADFTAASGGIITPLEVASGDWDVDPEADLAEADTAEETLPVSGTVSLYGFYVTNVANTALYWAERFDGAPWNYPSVGGELKLTPRFTLTDEE